LYEVFAVYGIGVVLVTQAAAIFLLCRAFAPEQWIRSLFSFLSICLSGLMLVLAAIVVWFFWFYTRQSF
jgi:hypothetical protein